MSVCSAIGFEKINNHKHATKENFKNSKLYYILKININSMHIDTFAHTNIYQIILTHLLVVNGSFSGLSSVCN